MKIALGLSIAVLVLGLVPAQVHAAASGTAWGNVIGSPSCDDGIGANHKCFLQLSAYSGDLTPVECDYPWDGWCAAIHSAETVIVSVYQKPILLSCAVAYTSQIVLDPYGTTHTHYCMGTCG